MTERISRLFQLTPLVFVVATFVALLVTPGLAQSNRAPVSQCQAIAQALPQVLFASYSAPQIRPAALSKEDVRITFAGHSTYVLETPGGNAIATDYSSYSGHVAVPNVVTMNKAHSSHYTSSPNPEIDHVLPGWNPAGGAIDHDIVVNDTYIRNVTTDIRRFETMEPDGNSIFIFEVAGLCIGHLGHLHHVLEDKHYGEIGRLDIVMVPVDGGLTLGTARMVEVVKRLRSSIVLPMHRRGNGIDTFLNLFGPDFDRKFVQDRGFTVSLRTLPRQPTIMILQGL